MMSAKQTTKVISDILNNAPDGVAVLYSGTTGIGKTYDWFHFISPALKADKKYYVSLSGISDTAGIRNALLGDYFRQNTHPVARALLFLLFLIISSAIIWPYQEKIFNLTTSETYNFIGNLLILGGLVFGLSLAAWKFSSFLSSFIYKYCGRRSQDILLKSVITTASVICFDDFEQLSGKAASQEVLNYFLELSKGYGIKILVISGNPTASKTQENSELFFKQGKIFDYCFQKTEGYDFISEIKRKLKDYPEAKEIFLRFYTAFADEPCFFALTQNFKICKKVVRNVKRFCREINKFGRRPDDYCMAIRYVIRTGFLNELGCSALIENSRYYNIDRNNPAGLSPEDFIEMLAFDDNRHHLAYFPELEKFILRKHFERKKLKDELYPEEQEDLTDFEETIFSFDIREICNGQKNKIEKRLLMAEDILKNQDENLFSRPSNFIQTFNRYSYAVFLLYPEDVKKKLDIFLNRTIKEFDKFSNSAIESLAAEIWNREAVGTYFANAEHWNILKKYGKRIKKTLVGILYLKAYFNPEKLCDDMKSNFPAAVAQLWGLSKKMLLQENLDRLFEEDPGLYIDLVRAIENFLRQNGQKLFCREINLTQLVTTSLNGSLDFALRDTPVVSSNNLKHLYELKDNLEKIPG